MRIEFERYWGFDSKYDIRIMKNNDHIFILRICLGYFRFYINLIK